jgi:hypothetical protein
VTRLLTIGGHEETLAVTADGVTYPDALDKAMMKARRLLDGSVVRDWPEAGDGDWWLYSSETESNVGGSAVSGTFVFARRFDPDDGDD